MYKNIRILIATFLLTITGVGFFLFNSKKVIYVYSDEGVGPESLSHTLLTCHAIASDKYIIKTINAKEIIDGKWMKRAALLIMPGGADLYYMKKLNGKGNVNIKQYVQNGGSFLGICAGSYYASKHIEFDKNGPLEVIGDRELSFFPGKAIGPVFKQFDYHSKVCTAAVLIENNHEQIYTYYYGGPYYADVELYPNIEVLYRYKDLPNKPAAMILIKYGNGRVLLSGVHIEHTSDFLDLKDPYLEKLEQALKGDNVKRTLAFKTILRRLNIMI